MMSPRQAEEKGYKKTFLFFQFDEASAQEAARKIRATGKFACVTRRVSKGKCGTATVIYAVWEK